jgi:hypothetical protein
LRDLLGDVALSFILLLAEVDVLSISEDEVDRSVEIPPLLEWFLLLVVSHCLGFVYEVIQYSAALIADEESILKLLLQPLVLLFTRIGPARLGFPLAMGIVLADIIIEVLQSWAIELSDLFKALLEFEEFQFGKVLVQIFGNGLSGGFEDGVPVVAVEVAREWNFIHDESVLHGLFIIIIKGN